MHLERYLRSEIFLIQWHNTSKYVQMNEENVSDVWPYDNTILLHITPNMPFLIAFTNTIVIGLIVGMYTYNITA